MGEAKPMNKHLRLPLALALALGSSHAMALGLGQIQVKSALNQPLEAEIELLSPTPAELENLRVQLASTQDAQRVGGRASGPYANLQFSVGRSGSKHVIKVTTPDRVTSPFLSFMLDVNWGKGRLLREYTVLLDPPRTAPAVARTQAATTPVREPARAPAQAVEPAPAPAAPVAPAPSRPTATAASPAAPAPAAAPAFSGDQYGPVASGETLWAIAQRVRADTSLSHNQVMMALLRANPEAFAGNNINRLKRGAVLRIPSQADMAALAAAEAAAQVRSQMQSWRGEAVATAPQPAEPRAARPESAAPTTRTRPGEPRLEITPPASGDTQSAQSGAAPDSAGTSELRAELARSREESASRAREVTELRDRVRELEGIKADGERLLALKDSELAALQKRLAELESRQTDAAAAPAVADPVPAADAAASSDTAEPATSDAPVDAASADQAAAAASDEAPVVTPRERERPRTRPAPAEQAAPSAAPAPPPAAPPPAKAWYQNYYILGGIGVLVLGLLGLLGLRRKSASAESGTSNGRRYDSAAAAASVPSHFGSTESSAADEEAMDREAALLDAVAESPTDLSRHLELVQHYYAQSDAEAFEGSAEAMYAQVDDADDMRWKQVLAMGREFLPDHPLFAEPARPEEPATAIGEQLAPPDRSNAFESKPFSAAAAAADDMESLDFGSDDDFSFGPDDGQTKAAQAPTQSDFESEIEPEPEPVSLMLDEGDDLLAEPASDADVDEDASATKLELARAYLDMGDVEGARAMLEEVANEGNAGQRSEAKRLLDEIR